MLKEKNEVCLLFSNFKPVSNQTKIQKFFKIIFITKHIRNFKTLKIVEKKMRNKRGNLFKTTQENSN